MKFRKTHSLFSTKAQKIGALLTSCVLMFALAGCDTWERATIKTLSADKGWIDQAFDDYNSGRIANTPAIHDLLITARAKHNDVTQLFLSYVRLEQVAQKNCDQACKDNLTKASDLVNAGLDELKGILTSLQDLIQGEKKATVEYPYTPSYLPPWRDPGRLYLI